MTEYGKEDSQEKRRWWRRHPKQLLAMFVISTVGFFSAAAYAVWNGTQADEGTCEAVIGLREDLVQVLEEQRQRSLQNILETGLDPKRVNQDFDRMINTIGDPKCP